MRIPPFDSNKKYRDDDDFELIQSSLIDSIFEFIANLQQSALQLKMNHWQTTSFAEHKSTDAFVDVLNTFADAIAESAMGEFQRPKIKSYHSTVTDITSTSTRWVLDSLREKTNDFILILKDTEHEGLLSIVSDFDVEFKKAIYLSTLT